LEKIRKDTEIDINEIITELRFLETEEEEKNIYFSNLFKDSLNIIKSKLNIDDKKFKKLKKKQ